MKRGQVTIFIIVAIVIVVLAMLIYSFFPKVKLFLGGVEQNPNSIMKDCIEKEILENVKNISSQGGSLNPEFYFLYKNERLRYLCYTSEYYKTCVVQEPMLVNSVEKEIAKSIETAGKDCLEKLQGYGYEISDGNMSVDLMPEKIMIIFNNKLISRNSGDVKTYDSIQVVVNNNLYELLSIADNIISFEAHYGDAETTTYMDYYRNLKVQKILQSDGSKVYIIEDRDTGDKFQFASKGLSWPPGYGIDLIIE